MHAVGRSSISTPHVAKARLAQVMEAARAKCASHVCVCVCGHWYISILSCLNTSFVRFDKLHTIRKDCVQER